MNKKKLLSLALVVILITTISFGTLAWFNDTKEVTNTFKIASTEGGEATDPDDIFSVALYEPFDVDGDGTISDEEKKNDKGLTFDKILPGSELHKEPTVQNTGAYDQYIRVVVKLSDITAWLDVLGSGYNMSTVFEGHDENKWTREVGTTVNDEAVYVYYYNEILKPGETAVLFDKVVIPTQLTQDDMAKLDGEFKLTIRADAIQTENLGADAKTSFQMANWGAWQNVEPQPLP